VRRIFEDLRFASRLFFRNPKFSSALILTLALGIGANTAIFSMVNALVLQPLPYKEAGRLVQIEGRRLGELAQLSMPEVDDLRQVGSFREVAAYKTAQYNFAGVGAPEEVRATISTHQLFSLLGVKPLIGDIWTDANDRNEDYVVLLSHSFWTRKFSSDPLIVGKQILMDGAPYTVVGVLPPGFQFPVDSQVFRCWGTAPRFYLRRIRTADVVASLAPGRSLTQAQRDIEGLSRRLAIEHPDTNRQFAFALQLLRDSYIGGTRPYLFILGGVVGFVLLIACANVINLLLSRSVARSREIAIRSSLGASRARLIRQLIAESVLVSLIGGVFGLFLAWAGIRILSRLIPGRLPLGMTIAIDGRVLGFLFLISAITGIIAGLIPALNLSRPDLNEILKESSRGSTGGHQNLRGIVVAVEVAIATVMLIAAATLIQTVFRLQEKDIGIRPENLLTFRVALGWKTYDLPRATRFHAEALERLRALPGVRDAAYNTDLPFSDRVPKKIPVLVEGGDRAQDTDQLATRQRVSPNYHRVMGIPLVHGRLLDDQDRQNTLPVALVSREAARTLWHGEDPVEHRLCLNPAAVPRVWHTVVGIVDNIQSTAGIDIPGVDVYLSGSQSPDNNVTYVVRTEANPSGFADAVEKTIHQLDPEQSIYDVLPMDVRIDEKLWQLRLSETLFAIFGLLALSLSAIGTAGVISYTLKQRRRELGIRMALGARTANISWLIMRQTLILAATGAVAGVIASFSVSRVMTGLLEEVRAADPLFVTVVPVLLLLTVAVVSYMPVWRATRLDPLVTLREE
jgi:putative ABC transport system permease protein